MKRLFMYSLLGFLSFNAFKSEALTPFEAASLAQAAEKKDADHGDYIEGFQLIAQEIERPNRDAVDQIFAQLWANHAEKEYVVVFNTKKAKSISELKDVLLKVYPMDAVVTFAREQGRIYNDQVVEKYPELAGGYVQQVGAMLVSGVTNATYGLGRGLSYAASGIGSLFSSKQTALAEQEENEQNNIKSLPDGYLGNLVETAYNLYLKLMNHADNDEYTIKVVGHCLGGYYAQIIASNNDLDGYSFSSFGIDLLQTDKSKNFVNYRHRNDHLTTLNEQHYGKTTALNDLPLTVIDNLDDHIRTLKIKDSIGTRWNIMQEYLTKNHAIDGFVDQLNPGNKKSKNVQNSNAHIVDHSVSSSALPISSPAVPKAEEIAIKPSIAPVASKPAVSIVPEVKAEAEEIIIAPSIVPAPSFAPPPPPPLPMDDVIDSPVADGKPMTKAQELLYKQKLAKEKAAKASAANKSALADRLAALRNKVEEVSVIKVSEEQDMKNAKIQEFIKEYESISNNYIALQDALDSIAEEQEAYKDSLKDAEVKALFDENCLRRDALKALQSRLNVSKKK
jgi:hypothetical protein